MNTITLSEIQNFIKQNKSKDYSIILSNVKSEDIKYGKNLSLRLINQKLKESYTFFGSEVFGFSQYIVYSDINCNIYFITLIKNEEPRIKIFEYAFIENLKIFNKYI